MITDGGLPFAGLALTRPRSARPFRVEDVRRLEQLRPWLAQAFGQRPAGGAFSGPEHPVIRGKAVVLSGQMVVTPDMKRLFQTEGTGTLLPVQALIRRITGVAKRVTSQPPRIEIENAFGLLTLEANWLMPADPLPEDIARDPRGCLTAISLALCEHPVAHAARVLRKSGATPAQMKAGVQLALGKIKPTIASELGIKLSSVESLGPVNTT